jgi:hypothetical protein
MTRGSKCTRSFPSRSADRPACLRNPGQDRPVGGPAAPRHERGYGVCGRSWASTHAAPGPVPHGSASARLAVAAGRYRFEMTGSENREHVVMRRSETMRRVVRRAGGSPPSTGTERSPTYSCTRPYRHERSSANASSRIGPGSAIRPVVLWLARMAAPTLAAKQPRPRPSHPLLTWTSYGRPSATGRARSGVDAGVPAP